MKPSTDELLAGLVALEWISVAFLLDSSGKLISSIGDSIAFSPLGEFQEALPEEGDDETSLYIASITPSIYMGVLYSSDIAIEEVRSTVDQYQAPLADLIGE